MDDKQIRLQALQMAQQMCAFTGDSTNQKSPDEVMAFAEKLFQWIKEGKAL